MTTTNGILDLAELEGPITRILTAPGTDLSTISAKGVRKALLGEQYTSLGLTAQVLKTRREDVDGVIKRVYERVSGGGEGSDYGGGGGNAKGDGGRASEHEHQAKRKQVDKDGDEDGEAGKEAGDGDGYGEEEAEPSSKAPKKKKIKQVKSVEESDAALARKLASEINRGSRRGVSSSAGGGATTPRKGGKRKAKKSAETVESDDNDDDEKESKGKKRGTAKGGFAREYTLSGPLAAVLEIDKLSRPQVVKKLWEYIRRNELQNPSNRKEIVCDDALRAVFSVDKIDMFRMNKVLGQHLHEE